MATPLISVIIPTYNRCDMLQGALRTLINQETGSDFRYEIIVIDNASTDATPEVVDQVANESSVAVRYLYHADPGPAPARNCGVAQAEGDWIAFFDDDELAEPDWLRELYRAAIETGADIVGGAMQLDLPQDVLDKLGKVVRTTSLREIDYYRTVRRFSTKRLPGTNNAIVARHVIERIGVFDPAKIGAGSDSDFFLRAREADMGLYYTPKAIVRHLVPPNRLTIEYLRWDARQGCTAFAGLDYKYKGSLRLILQCVARLVHALLIVIPQLGWSWMTNNPGEVLGQRVRLWRAEGYIRATLAILAPAWCAQEGFFADLNFRRGRIVGKQEMQVETPASV